LTERFANCEIVECKYEIILKTIELAICNS